MDALVAPDVQSNLSRSEMKPGRTPGCSPTRGFAWCEPPNGRPMRVHSQNSAGHHRGVLESADSNRRAPLPGGARLRRVLPPPRAESSRAEQCTNRERVGDQHGRPLRGILDWVGYSTITIARVIIGSTEHPSGTCHSFDGPTGLDAALQHQPDVIVCDIGLPGLDGYEIARTLRQAPHPTTLLIAVSGYGESGDREKARIAGFSHHITKPADPVALADLIANNDPSESSLG